MARCHICSILIAMFHDVSHSNAGETSGSNACLQSRSQRIAGARGCRLEFAASVTANSVR